MKKFKLNSFRSYVILAFLSLAIGCSSKSFRCPVGPQAVLVNDPARTCHAIDSVGTIIDGAIDSIVADSEKNTLILFVHGRGDHPNKAFKENLISDLESDYAAKVVMFHWPSNGSPINYPEDEARESARDFGRVLKILNSEKKGATKSIQYVLLVHSLGSYVLEQFSLGNNSSELAGIFDNLLLSSSSSEAKSHANWVESLTIANNIIVTTNRNDSVLKFAGTRKFGKRLGKSLVDGNGNQYTLASNTQYIDVTKLDLNHRYYLQKKTGNSQAFQKILRNILTGQSPDLSASGAIQSGSSQVYHF